MKQTVGLLPQGRTFGAPGICHWLLQQESPEVLVIDDLRQDARYELECRACVNT